MYIFTALHSCGAPHTTLQLVRNWLEAYRRFKWSQRSAELSGHGGNHLAQLVRRLFSLRDV